MLALASVTSALAIFSLALPAFASMHAVVLALLLHLVDGRGGRARRLRVDLRGLCLSAQFVATEALMLACCVGSGLVVLSPPSLTQLVVVPAISLLFWEGWFYAAHRLMHTRALYSLHRMHHAHRGLHPSLAFGAGETVLLSAGFYLPLVVAPRLGGSVSVATLAVTFTVAYALNVLSHLDNNLLGERHDDGAARHLLNSARYHAVHHRVGIGNFGLVTPWFDALFGTRILVSGRQARSAGIRTPSRARRARA